MASNWDTEHGPDAISTSGASVCEILHAEPLDCSTPLLICSRRIRACQPWYNEDVWTSVMSFLDGKSLMRLALANHQFHAMVMEERLWKALCVRELGLPLGVKCQSEFSWRNLYGAATDGSHSFTNSHQREKHIDWMRIGAFCLDSGEAIASAQLSELKSFCEDGEVGSSSSMSKFHVVHNVKKGIWIAGVSGGIEVHPVLLKRTSMLREGRKDEVTHAYVSSEWVKLLQHFFIHLAIILKTVPDPSPDLHLVRCPVCNLATCEGTMQMLEVRHWQLFLHKEYTAQEWQFEPACSHSISHHCSEAGAGVFDAGHFRSKETQDILDLKTWVAPVGNWQPMGTASHYAAAASTNLLQNDGYALDVSQSIGQHRSNTLLSAMGTELSHVLQLRYEARMFRAERLSNAYTTLLV